MRIRRVVCALAVLVTVIVPLTSQTRGGSTDVQEAREELNSMLDLGRMFGFILTMSTEEASLRLSDAQAADLLEITREVRQTTRLTGIAAETYLTRIEDEILTARQLIATDQLWIASERERSNIASDEGQQRGAGRGSGDQTGTPDADGTEQTEPVSELAAFAAGGDFNPLVDGERPQGESLLALLSYLEDRLGNR